MLIITADDLGASPSATDPILALFSEGLITSASAMVWMPDSERAAQLIRADRHPVGLHLNLTLPFNDPDMAPDMRERQLTLTKLLGGASWRDRAEQALDRTLLIATIDDQLSCFRRQFGEPTHIDGHHYVQIHPAVRPLLGNRWPIRPAPTAAGEMTGRSPSRFRQRLVRAQGANLCVPFEKVHPAVGGLGLDLLAYSRDHVLEVVVHPQRPAELAALRSTEWRAALRTLPLGSYASRT